MMREELLEDVMFESRDLSDEEAAMTRLRKEGFKQN